MLFWLVQSLRSTDHQKSRNNYLFDFDIFNGFIFWHSFHRFDLAGVLSLALSLSLSLALSLSYIHTHTHAHTLSLSLSLCLSCVCVCLSACVVCLFRLCVSFSLSLSLIFSLFSKCWWTSNNLGADVYCSLAPSQRQAPWAHKCWCSHSCWDALVLFLSFSLALGAFLAVLHMQCAYVSDFPCTRWMAWSQRPCMANWSPFAETCALHALRSTPLLGSASPRLVHYKHIYLRRDANMLC